jgi:hypothetical protein
MRRRDSSHCDFAGSAPPHSSAELLVSSTLPEELMTPPEHRSYTGLKGFLNRQLEARSHLRLWE